MFSLFKKTKQPPLSKLTEEERDTVLKTLSFAETPYKYQNRWNELNQTSEEALKKDAMERELIANSSARTKVSQNSDNIFTKAHYQLTLPKPPTHQAIYNPNSIDGLTRRLKELKTAGKKQKKNKTQKKGGKKRKTHKARLL
jgi:hypothetical protein